MDNLNYFMSSPEFDQAYNMYAPSMQPMIDPENPQAYYSTMMNPYLQAQLRFSKQLSDQSMQNVADPIFQQQRAEQQAAYDQNLRAYNTAVKNAGITNALNIMMSNAGVTPSAQQPNVNIPQMQATQYPTQLIQQLQSYNMPKSPMDYQQEQQKIAMDLLKTKMVTDANKARAMATTMRPGATNGGAKGYTITNKTQFKNELSNYLPSQKEQSDFIQQSYNVSPVTVETQPPTLFGGEKTQSTRYPKELQLARQTGAFVSTTKAVDDYRNATGANISIPTRNLIGSLTGELNLRTNLPDELRGKPIDKNKDPNTFRLYYSEQNKNPVYPVTKYWSQAELNQKRADIAAEIKANEDKMKKAKSLGQQEDLKQYQNNIIILNELLNSLTTGNILTRTTPKRTGSVSTKE